MEARPVLQTLLDAPAAVVVGPSSREEVAAAYRGFGSLDDHEIGGRRWSGLSPWERHPHGDELLMPLDGSYVVTLLTPERRDEVTVSAGSILIVPKGVWHRIHAAETVIDFGIASIGDDEISFSENPLDAP